MGGKLVKSGSNKMISGVCGGLAQSFGIDATLVRVIFVAASIFGVGSPILLYIILALLMPVEN